MKLKIHDDIVNIIISIVYQQQFKIYHINRILVLKSFSISL